MPGDWRLTPGAGLIAGRRETLVGGPLIGRPLSRHRLSRGLRQGRLLRNPVLGCHPQFSRPEGDDTEQQAGCRNHDTDRAVKE